MCHERWALKVLEAQSGTKIELELVQELKFLEWRQNLSFFNNLMVLKFEFAGHLNLNLQLNFNFELKVCLRY